MNSTLILFKEIGRQLLIVGLVLGSLPMAIRILWKLRLLPLGCYFVATKLFWPRWAAAHRTVCILIFIACVLFFVLWDNPLHSPEARGTDHGRADTPLHKGPEVRRIQDIGISLNSQKELRPDLGRNSFMHRAFHAPDGQSLSPVRSTPAY